ncbi:two-component system response regulator [Pseudoxanthobacter sp.]|uniref:response regulator n=1 Tax=Pseudoxanthobacter sp. TaxID=1925742 RepID=UPI002FE40738
MTSPAPGSVSGQEAGERNTILLVDDTPDNLALLSGLLRGTYRVRVANSGARALQIVAADAPPDLVLLDVMMPDMDGYEVCRRLKSDPATRDVPVIFITARSLPEDEERGFAAGAADYITKPISPPILMARVANHLALRSALACLADQNRLLAHAVRQRTSELERVQNATILAMASLAETRDNETGNHIRRTQHYVRALAVWLRDHPEYGPELTPENIDLLFRSAPLHDIGKVGVRDNVLLKPGALTPDEFEHMKTHTTIGRDVIQAVEREVGPGIPFLRIAREVAYSHQEKWDGSGYPQGLSGTDIPLSARLMAVADVYDALISERIYKRAMAHEEAVEVIRRGRGSHFDPAVVDAFLAVAPEFQTIARRFND